MTAKEALTRAAGQLSAHTDLRGRALADAALLLMHTLGVGRAELISHPERRFTREEQAAYQRVIERRLRFEPVQYIIGEQEFMGLAFQVTPAVLIPRPETEGLVEAVLARTSGVPRIVDVGTGSGAIAVALAVQRPGGAVTGVDLSDDALAVARKNGERHNVSVRWQQSDLLSAVAGERFECVVSNPPYVATNADLTAEVRDWEPGLALFGGPDGLEIYSRLIPQAAELLTPGGLLVMEIGFGQKEAISALLKSWKGVETLADLRAIPRVVVAWKR